MGGERGVKGAGISLYCSYKRTRNTAGMSLRLATIWTKGVRKGCLLHLQPATLTFRSHGGSHDH